MNAKSLENFNSVIVTAMNFNINSQQNNQFEQIIPLHNNSIHPIHPLTINAIDNNNHNKNKNLNAFTTNPISSVSNESNESDENSLDIIGHEFGLNTTFYSKLLLKELESKILKRVDLNKEHFIKHAMYIYIDIDEDDTDKVWANRSSFNYKSKV